MKNPEQQEPEKCADELIVPEMNAEAAVPIDSEVLVIGEENGD